MSSNLQKPRPSDLDDTPGAKTSLLAILSTFYDAIVALSRAQSPATVPALKSVTLPTHKDLRNVVGDYAGELGPRACIVTGRFAPLDGGEGVYVWDATSVANDDDAATVQPNLVLVGKPGRWRKGSF